MMAQARHLRPMGVGDILDETIQLFRRNFGTFVAIAAVVEVPLIVLQLLQAAILQPWAGSRPSPGAAEFAAISGLVLGILGAFAFIVIEAALIHAISEHYMGREPTIESAYGAAIDRFGYVFRATVLVGVLSLLMAITIVGIPFAIYFGLRWTLCIQAIMLDLTNSRGSLSRSSELVKGSWWRVLGVLTLGSMIQYLLTLPGMLVVLVIGGVAALIDPGAVGLISILGGAIAGLFQVVVMPLMPIVMTLLYYDLRIRKEGLDLQIRAEQLGQGLPSAM